MSLNVDYSRVDRSKWPDPGVHLFDFATMMMLTGVPYLETDADEQRLRVRALMMDAVKGFGWKHHNKTENQLDMIDLIPLMRGVRTNVTKYSVTEFVKRLKEMGLS